MATAETPNSSSTQLNKKQASLSSSSASVAAGPQQQPAHIPTSAFTPVNDLPLEIKEPIKITTSKKWVLPPRPKPGRKPVSSGDLDTTHFPIDKESTKSKVCKPDIHTSSGSHHHHTHNHLRQVTSEKKQFTFPPERNHSISGNIPSINNSLVSSPLEASSSCLSPKSSSSCMPTPSPTPDSLSPKLEANAQVAKQTIPSQTQPQPHTQARSQPHPQLEKRKRSVAKLNSSSNTNTKKKHDSTSGASNINNITNSNKMIEVDCSIIHNPMKTEILKINEENYYLKLEVIRLVSNLKSLRDEIQPMVEKRKTKTSRKVRKDKSNSKSSPSPASVKPTSTITPSSKTPNSRPASVSKAPLKTVPSPAQQAAKENPEKDISKKSISQSPTPPTTSTKTTTSTTKKRNHDDDINDLILSLIDLSHSQQTSEPKSSTEEAPGKDCSSAPITDNISASMDTNNTSITGTITEHTNTNTGTKHDMKRNTEINRNKATPTPTTTTTTTNINTGLQLEASDKAQHQSQRVAGTVPADFALVASSTTASSAAISPSVTDINALKQGQQSHIQSPVFSTDLVNDPFLELSSKSLLEKQILYDEDDLDLLSTVSTTPSTMFSLSLSATNETVDSMAGSGSVLMSGLDNIDELPPFDLLNLPDEKAIAAGKLDIRHNYERSANDIQYPLLDTFSLLDENNDYSSNKQHTASVAGGSAVKASDDHDIGSLELVNATDRKVSEQMFIDGVNGMYSTEAVDFTMSGDVDSVFDAFVNGRN